MNSSPKTRRAILPLTIGLLALGVAVFGWGLHYKMSQYRSKHIAGHHWQAANLLTDRERSPAQQVTTVHEPRFDITFDLALLPLLYVAFDLLVHRRVRARYGQMQSRRSWRLCAEASFHSFFFRPPPSVLTL